MSNPTTPHTRMTHMARRIPSSSGVLDLLGHARPRAYAALESLI